LLAVGLRLPRYCQSDAACIEGANVRVWEASCR
jgi:hypothetical protein